MMTQEQALFLRTLRQVMDERLASFRPAVRDVTINGRDMPAPQVYNEVRTPEVHVHVPQQEQQPPPQVHNAAADLSPVAAALDRMTEAVAAAMAEMVHAVRAMTDAHAGHVEMLSQLVQTLGSQEPPTVVVRGPKPAMVDPFPQEPTVQPKREMEVIHADGSKSTIREV
jgi:hypothetical protein